MDNQFGGAAKGFNGGANAPSMNGTGMGAGPKPAMTSVGNATGSRASGMGMGSRTRMTEMGATGFPATKSAPAAPANRPIAGTAPATRLSAMGNAAAGMGPAGTSAAAPNGVGAMAPGANSGAAAPGLTNGAAAGPNGGSANPAGGASPAMPNPMNGTAPANGMGAANGAAPTAANPAEGAAPKPKKSKKGLIIGVSCGAGALLVGGGAAVAVVMLTQPDPVTAAMNKLVDSGLPANMSVSGEVNMQGTDDSGEGSHVRMALTSDFVTATGLNSSSLTFSMDAEGLDENAAFSLDAIDAGENGKYIKANGFSSMIQSALDVAAQNGGENGEDPASWISRNSSVWMSETPILRVGETEAKETILNEVGSDEEATTWIDEDPSTWVDEEPSTWSDEESSTWLEEDPSAWDSGDTMLYGESTSGEVSGDLEGFGTALMQMLLGALETMEGNWIRIDDTSEEANMSVGDIMGSFTPSDSVDPSVLDCGETLIEMIRDNATSLAQLYRENPFISGSDEGVTVASKQYPVYRVVIDQEKYKAFVQAAQGQDLFGGYLTCANETTEDLLAYPNDMPTLYAEVDKSKHFSRLNFAMTRENSTLNAELNLAYPESLNIQAPADYMTMEELEEAIMQEYGM